MLLKEMEKERERSVIYWAAEPLSRQRGNSRGWMRRKMQVISKSSFWDLSGSLRGDFTVYTRHQPLCCSFYEYFMLHYFDFHQNITETHQTICTKNVHKEFIITHPHSPTFRNFYINSPTFLIGPTVVPWDESPNPYSSKHHYNYGSYYYHSAQTLGAVLCYRHGWYLKSCTLLSRGVLLLCEVNRFMVKISSRLTLKRGHSHI